MNSPATVGWGGRLVHSSVPGPTRGDQSAVEEEDYYSQARDYHEESLQKSWISKENNV